MRVNVITIGSATRDAFVRSKDFSAEPNNRMMGGQALVMPLGAKLEVPDIIFSTGGGATNTAVTFARQGIKTGCLCVAGDDVAGQAIVHDLKKENINTSLIRKSRKQTGFSILLEPLHGGERTVVVHRGASEDLSRSTISWSKLNASWFYISSLGGNIALLKRIVQFAKEKKISVAYNPGGKELAQRTKLIPILKGIHVLIANREEAALITGKPFNDEKAIFRTWDEMSPGINVMSDGRNGVMVSDGQYIYKAGIFKERKLVDRTGAGDAFGSGFVAGIIQKPHDLERAIRLGSANATSKVEGIGAKHGLLSLIEFERNKRWKHLQITRQRI